MRLRICFAILLFLNASPAAGQAGEISLRTGPFPSVAGAVLGAPVIFENEITRYNCFPLMLSGKIVAWLHRTHTFGGTTVVERCIEERSGGAPVPAERRSGDVSEGWERLVLRRPGVELNFTPLTLPAWGTFANPAFCGSRVAYWGENSSALIPSVYDLTSLDVTVSAPIEDVKLETDDPQYLPKAIWNATCSLATFDGEVVGGSRIRLVIRR